MSTPRLRTRVPPFRPQQLEAIAKVLAGLTGSEIGHALASCRIPDVDPQNTKWKRLHNALAEFQNEHGVGNHVVVFIRHVLDPACHVGCPERFRDWQAELNKILSLAGMEVRDNGKVCRTVRAENIDDAVARARRLKSALERRQVHPNVLTHCQAEIVAENCFHAVLEAMKSVTTRIRSLSGLDGDGALLVQAALGGNTPRLRVNTFETETQRGEQRGFSCLLIGMYGMIRNPLAHEARIEWPMSEPDALDIMTTISYIHRKLDGAERTVSPPPPSSAPF